MIFSLSGTWQKTEDERPGFENINTAYSPQFLGYFKADYRITPNISAAITGNYVDDMETYWDETPVETAPGIMEPTGRIGQKVGSYFNTGSNLRINNLFRKNIFLSLRASNIFDTEIRYPTFTNNPRADRGTLDRGRSFFLSLGIKY